MNRRRQNPRAEPDGISQRNKEKRLPFIGNLWYIKGKVFRPPVS